jgi:hypothetical protein
MSQSNIDNTVGAMSTTIAAHYKTRFHREVIFSTLAFNPELDLATIRNAVEANLPAKFLPQPWPPVSTDDVSTLKVLTLSKMKYTVCVGTGLGGHHAVILHSIVADKYPMLWDLTASELKMFEADVFLGVDGQVTYNFRTPEAGQFPYSLGLQGDENLMSFIVPMLAHGMASMVEAGDFNE